MAHTYYIGMQTCVMDQAATHKELVFLIHMSTNMFTLGRQLGPQRNLTFFRTAGLQPLLCTVPDADELLNYCNIYTAQAHCGKFALGSQTGVPKLLGLCQQISLLVLGWQDPWGMSMGSAPSNLHLAKALKITSLHA